MWNLDPAPALPQRAGRALPLSYHELSLCNDLGHKEISCNESHYSVMQLFPSRFFLPAIHSSGPGSPVSEVFIRNFIMVSMVIEEENITSSHFT